MYFFSAAEVDFRGEGLVEIEGSEVAITVAGAQQAVKSEVSLPRHNIGYEGLPLSRKALSLKKNVMVGECWLYWACRDFVGGGNGSSTESGLFGAGISAASS